MMLNLYEEKYLGNKKGGKINTTQKLLDENGFDYHLNVFDNDKQISKDEQHNILMDEITKYTQKDPSLILSTKQYQQGETMYAGLRKQNRRVGFLKLFVCDNVKGDVDIWVTNTGAVKVSVTDFNSNNSFLGD